MKARLIIIPATIFITSVSFNTISNGPEKKIGISNKAQSTDFAFFRTHHQGKGVTATWGVISNAEVAGFSVQRTYEDPNDPYAYWEDLASIACSSSRSFKYTDETVFPGFVNYRIVALLNDGTTITSEVSTVRIVSK